MIPKLVVLVSILVLVGCGQGVVEIGAGQATAENAAAAVVLLEGDRSEAGDQVEAIQQLVDPDAGRPFRPNIRLTSVSREGEPSGGLYLRLIFQDFATVEDRQVIAERVAELGLDDPIWLGPEDPWPFCQEEPCGLVREDGGFPN